MTSTAPARLLTAEEYEHIPDPPGLRSELVRGRIVTMPPPSGRHGQLTALIAGWFVAFTFPRRLGIVRAESGFIVERGPDTVRGPDVSFVRAGQPEDEGRTWPEGAPTLAVEVVSPDQSRAYVNGKVQEYLAAGAERVWEVRPKQRTIVVHRPGAEPVTYRAGDILTSDDAGFQVEGFALDVAALFA